MYMYTYCHPQTNYFVVSQLFGVARHVRHSKPGLIPASLYGRLMIYLNVSSGINAYVSNFVCLHFA